MNSLVFCITFLGYGFSYDGYLENKHYFQVNTPKVDYGFVVENKMPYVYCDTVLTRK